MTLTAFITSIGSLAPVSASRLIDVSHPPAAVAPAALESGQGPLVGYDDGFYVRSADGENEFTIGGLFQFGANVFDSRREPSLDFDVRRMRLEFSAKVAGALRVHMEPNFLPDGVELEEAWCGLDVLHGDALLMLGRMKAPFGLEEVRSRRPIDFPRFSILDQFAPAEDHGIFLNGGGASKAWEYGVAAYNGTGDSDTNSSKDVAVRAAWHPFADRSNSIFQNLHVGLAGTLGDQTEDVSGSVIANELGLPVLEYASGVQLDGLRTRVGIEGAWFAGPWFAQAEYVHVAQDMSLGAVDENIAFQGAYVSIARVLTGEDKTFRGIQPTRPRDFASGEGRGAWVLAARWSDLELDALLDNASFAVPGTFTDRIRTFSIGLNWIANEHLTVRHAFVETLYSSDVALDDGSTDHEEAFLVEMQLSF